MIAPREVLTTGVGAWRTQSLYLETNRSGLEPIMTLKEVDWEHKGVMLPSLHRLYMEIADVTEYQVAIQVFGSWKGWQRQCENAYIKEYIEAWREELEIAIRSAAVAAMVQTSTAEGSKGTAASKYLADKGWIKRKAGAPSLEEREGELKKQQAVGATLKDDFKRLGLVKK
jgi:hypothetical protein